MQRLFYSIVLTLLLTFSLIAQTTYYVSSSGGNNNNSGTSSSSPWKTLSKLNSVSLRAGDRIYLKKGDVWREQLNISASGTSSSRIIFGSYGSGNKPIISGADIQSGFVWHSGNIWKKYVSLPQQVFFNGARGTREHYLSRVDSDKKWYWSSNYLYVYSHENPSGAIQTSERRWGIFITGDYITIEDIQVEKVEDSGIEISSGSIGVVVDNCTFYQWSDLPNAVQGAVTIDGSYSEVKNSTLGKKTGNDIADQGWAGFAGIIINGKSNSVTNNKIYHTSTENENSNGYYAVGIKVISTGGNTKISKNYIYHTGSHAIQVTTNTRSGDEIHIFDNEIEYPGQAGISLYKTRGDDGVGGRGYVYRNEVSFANRLGGDVGSNGTQASGIHFNNGVRSGTDPNKPYMKWYCYENKVHDNRSLKLPNSPDASGISMDYNANNVEVFRNIVYNNYSKGIYIWNANNCKIYYNLIYGNDAGTTVTALAGGVESADNNQIYNNTYYKNYNGNGKGQNIHAEIYFGMNGKNNTFKNNILYAAKEGYAYIYNRTNTGGHVLDNNIIYSERSIVANDTYKGQLTFSQWRSTHSTWDRNSKNADPQFGDPSSGNFSLKSNSPAINAGTLLNLTSDLLGRVLSGLPDIGAFEYGSSATSNDNGGSSSDGDVIVIKAMDGSLSGGAGLGSKTGMLNNRALYFSSSNGSALYKVNIPKAGNWYAIARMFYYSSGKKNSFYITLDGNRQVLGDDDSRYDKWHWDGSKGSKVYLGNLKASQYYLRISAREPGLTLWVDEIILTNNPNYYPSDDGSPSKSGSSSSSTAILINAMDGERSGGAGLGSKTGMINQRAVYFSQSDGSVLFKVDIPKEGTWYAIARMFYYSSGKKNSFYITINGNRQVLGDDDNRYDEWHWDGYRGSKVVLGTLKAAQYYLRISAREPGTTLWIDQIILTDDPNYSPSALAKQSSGNDNNETNQAEILPTEFEVSQNYPNPFNPSTTIKYAVPEAARVSLKVFDILGAEVATLVDEIKSPGYYEVNFNAAELASGIYIYQLRTNDFVQTKKMNLLK